MFHLLPQRSLFSFSLYKSTTIRYCSTRATTSQFAQHIKPVTQTQFQKNFTSTTPIMAGKDEKPSQGEKQEAHKNGSGTSEEIEGEHNEWKFKAPYKIHEGADKFNAIYEGSCHCGKVQYQLSREAPLDSKYCHCTVCQRLHGACFQWATIFHKEDINFTNGHHDLFWYDSQEKTTRHKLPCKVACSYCHSPIMDEGRNMILLFPSLIKFKSKEDRNKFAPKCHMFYGQRVVDIPDGKPKWKGMQNDSELIADSPPEEVKKRTREIEEEEKKKKEENDGNKKQKPN